MKKASLICLIILLFAVFALAGCTMRDGASAPAGDVSASATASPEPVVTPEPIPTPVPIELVIEQSKPSYVIPDSYELLSEALASIEEKNGLSLWAQKGNWYIENVGEARVSGTRMGEASRTGDIIAVDGEYLYMLADKDLVIIKLAADGASVVSRTKVGADWASWEDTSGQAVNGSEKVPLSVFCIGDRLIVVSDYYNYFTDNNDLGYTEYTAVDTYDISDPAWPTLWRSFGQDGAPVAARICEHALVLVTQWQYDLETENTDPSVLVPRTYYYDGYNDNPAVIDPESLLAVKDGSHSGCSIVGIYDSAAGGLTDERVIYGAQADPFIGDGEIIFYVPRVAEGYSRSYTDPDKGAATEFAAAACTDLYRFVLADGNTGYRSLSFDGVYTVEGVVSESRCLDRYEGQLRCATIRDERRRTDYADSMTKIDTFTSFDILLLDGTLTRTASVTDLADGNSDSWICFLGDRAVVTQESGSNLALLSDVSSPSQGKKLDRSVMAQAIRSLGDLGYTAFYRSEAGKLTLTVYDAQMEPLFERTFGSDHSSTLENQAGYFADGDRNIVAFSADDSYCVYSFDAEKGLILKGNVYLTDWAWNARGFIHNGLLYVADTRELFIYDLTDFSCLTQLRF